MFPLIENPVLNKSNRITLNYITYHTWTTNNKLFHILKPHKLSFAHWRVRLHVANDDDSGCRPSTGNRPRLFVHCSMVEWGDPALYIRKDYPGLADSENFILSFSVLLKHSTREESSLALTNTPILRALRK